MRAFFVLFGLVSLLQADDASLLRGSLDRFQRNLPGASSDALPESVVDRAAMKMSLTDSRTPWRARYLAAEWLLQAHLIRTRMAPVPSVTQENKDLEQAWKLITIAKAQSVRVVVGTSGADLYRGADPARRMAAGRLLADNVGQERVPAALTETMDTLALEIAVRLGNLDHMTQALAPVLPRTNLRARDKTFALMAAAHTGRWEAAKALGLQLAGTPVFKALHEGALADPGTFDYTVFAELDLEPAPSTTHGLPATRQFQVKDYRLHLATVEGDPDAAARVRATFPAGWRATGPLEAPLFRQGAAAHWHPQGDNTLPLTGAGSEHRLKLRGYLSLPGGGRRVDTLDLKPDTTRPGTWAGTLVSEQSSGAGQMVARFDVELELQ